MLVDFLQGKEGSQSHKDPSMSLAGVFTYDWYETSVSIQNFGFCWQFFVGRPTKQGKFSEFY